MGEFVKNETYKELRPANVYDVAANETWLEDMAREGYRLTAFTTWSGVFEPAEPCTCRYRMQPIAKKEKAPDAEQVEVYRGLGWDYAATIPGGFHVWRCDDPALPELDTDPVVQGMGYGYLKRRMLRDSAVDLLLAAALIALGAYVALAAGTPLLETLEQFAPGELVLWQLLWLLALVLLGLQARAMVRLLRALNAGIPLTRPRPYRGQKWLARGLACCVAGFLLLNVLGELPNMNGSSLAGGRDAYDWRDGPEPEVVYADLRVLDGAEDVEFFNVKKKFRELAPRMYTAQQVSLQPDGTVTAAAVTEYYRMLTPGLARQLAKELALARPGSLGVSPHGAAEMSEAPGLDGFWVDGEGQYAVALLGREVLALTYEPPTDLRTAHGYLAALLAA